VSTRHPECLKVTGSRPSDAAGLAGGCGHGRPGRVAGEPVQEKGGNRGRCELLGVFGTELCPLQGTQLVCCVVSE